MKYCKLLSAKLVQTGSLDVIYVIIYNVGPRPPTCPIEQDIISISYTWIHGAVQLIKITIQKSESESQFFFGLLLFV